MVNEFYKNVCQVRQKYLLVSLLFLTIFLVVEYHYLLTPLKDQEKLLSRKINSLQNRGKKINSLLLHLQKKQKCFASLKKIKNDDLPSFLNSFKNNFVSYKVESNLGHGGIFISAEGSFNAIQKILLASAVLKSMQLQEMLVLRLQTNKLLALFLNLEPV